MTTLKSIAETLLLKSTVLRRERLKLAARVAQRLATVADRSRAWATHFARAAEGADFEFALIKMPSGHHDSFVMNRWDNRDQIVRTMEQTGWKSFEYPMPDVFLSLAHARPGMVIDVGANTGLYSLIALGAHDENIVESFEPDLEPLVLLHKNALRNGHLARLTINDFALSNREAELEFYVPTQEHGQLETSSSLEASFKGAHSEVRRVHATTLDKYIGERTPLRKPVTIIKIDVEGHESSVVEGAQATIGEYRPYLFIELLPRAGFDVVQSLCERHRYVDVRLTSTEIVHATKVRFDPQGWNHLLVPEEKLADFDSLVSGLGLPIRRES